MQCAWLSVCWILWQQSFPIIAQHYGNGLICGMIQQLEHFAATLGDPGSDAHPDLDAHLLYLLFLPLTGLHE